MALVYLLTGMTVGFVASMVALAAGASVWSALLVYSVAGAVSVILFPVILLATGRLGEQGLRDEASDSDLEAAGEAIQGGSAPAPAMRAASAEQGLRILAVDDDPLIRDLLPRIAAEVGCPDITIASSGRQAIEFMETSAARFDCLLFDIDMPELDGIELCKHVRGMSAYRDTPIIMLTAISDMDHIARAFRAGATDYTTKPFDIIAFGARLRDAKVQVAAARAEATPKGHRAATGLFPPAEVAALIKRDALRNYLTQLSGAALTRSYVVAVLIEPAMGHSSDTNAAPSEQSLTAVAAAIDDVFEESGYLMAYTGVGQFILVAEAANLPNAGAIESAIQGRLNQMRLDAESLAEPFARVSVGRAVRLGESSAGRAGMAFDSAVALANHRSVARRRALQSGNVRHLRR